MKRHVGAFMVLALMLVAAASCTSAQAHVREEAHPFDPAKAAPDAMQVTASDYKFDVGRDSARAGTIEFVVGNIAKQRHEFVVVPVNNGRYGDPVGELEAFDPHDRRALKVDLAPGKYVFVCLLVSVEDGTAESHMALGMRAPFEVAR